MHPSKPQQCDYVRWNDESDDTNGQLGHGNVGDTDCGGWMMNDDDSNDDATEQVTAFVKDPHPRVRHAAINCLGQVIVIILQNTMLSASWRSDDDLWRRRRCQ